MQDGMPAHNRGINRAKAAAKSFVRGSTTFALCGGTTVQQPSRYLIREALSHQSNAAPPHCCTVRPTAAPPSARITLPESPQPMRRV